MRDLATFALFILLLLVGAYVVVSVMIFLTPLLIHFGHVSDAWWARRLGKV